MTATPMGYRGRKRNTRTQAKPVKLKTISGNRALGKIFAGCLFMGSLILNVWNIYQRVHPATEERFLATGILQFLGDLAGFSVLAFVFRLLFCGACILLVRESRKVRSKKVIYYVLSFVCGYCAWVGLANSFLTLPFLMAVILVAALQWLEILAWDLKERSVFLWMLIGLAYAFEIWLQYDMMPFHSDYANTFELIKGFVSPSFNWEGFLPIQVLLAVLGVLGIELGDRINKIIDNHE
ncbi:MAG: hypothetical protein F6K11_31330 [Leptolyngbya sp. SIO3F4]|nr:hypothetical protein [Leptolyngbya sp. SIO3F4]